MPINHAMVMPRRCTSAIVRPTAVHPDNAVVLPCPLSYYHKPPVPHGRESLTLQSDIDSLDALTFVNDAFAWLRDRKPRLEADRALTPPNLKDILVLEGREGLVAFPNLWEPGRRSEDA
jgi:hypothetical protein